MTSQWKTLANGLIVDLKLRALLLRDARLRRWSGMRGSSVEVEGTVKKLSLVIIFELTPFLNSLTCFLMYLRKASLDQRPNYMMVKTGIWAKTLTYRDRQQLPLGAVFWEVPFLWTKQMYHQTNGIYWLYRSKSCQGRIEFAWWWKPWYELGRVFYLPTYVGWWCHFLCPAFCVPLKKRMLFTVRTLSSESLLLWCTHMKKAPMKSSHSALSRGEIDKL